MLPTKSNLAETGCSPVSSNCVIWQGPAIACINLCNGDTVTDVVYKLATEICALKEQLDLTDLDFDCLVSSAVGTPQPEHTLGVALELLINKVCALDDIINGVSEDDGSVSLDPVLTVPQNAACFYTTDENGNLVTQITQSAFTKRIAVQVCALKTLTTQQSSALANHESRIGVLEARPLGSALPKVTPTCTFSSTTDVDLDVAWEALEQQFCQLRSITGTPTALSAALTYQCQGLGTEEALSSAGVMNALPGWKGQVTTVADALQNMFITICDMRAAVKDISINGSGSTTATGCSAIVVDFTATLNTERTVATFFFAGLTTIPTGYQDCTALGAKLTVSDSAGAKYTTFINVTDNATNTNGVTVGISGLNASLNYTYLLEACFSKDGSECLKSVTKAAPIACSIVTGVTASFV